MPILNYSGSTPLSVSWSHEDVASEVMVLTNTLDNELIQLYNIRNHINTGISYIAHLLNLDSSPDYGIWATAQLEQTLHPSGMEWININIDPNGIVLPIQFKRITRLNVLAQAGQQILTDWVGNCTKADIAQLTQLNSFQNTQHRYSVFWAHHGSDLICFVGRGISTAANPKFSGPYIAVAYNLAPQNFVIWGHRKPILDTLLPPNDPANNYSNITGTNAFVDIPDEHVELLIKMTQKKVLEQLREQVPQQLDAEINQGVAQIVNNLTAELNFEKAEREKRKYGDQQRSPGAMA